MLSAMGALIVVSGGWVAMRIRQLMVSD